IHARGGGFESGNDGSIGVGDPGTGGGGGGGHILLQSSTRCLAGDVSGGPDIAGSHPITYPFPGQPGAAGVFEFLHPETAPAIDAGSDQYLTTCAGCLQPVTLTGSATDADGDPLQY